MKIKLAIAVMIFFAFVSVVNAQEVIITDVDILKEDIHSLALKYKLTDKETLIHKIIGCESGLDPKAINQNKRKDGTIKSTDFSWWQLNDYWWSDYFSKKNFDIRDPDDNLEAGFILFKEQGVKPWFLSSHCWSK